MNRHLTGLTKKRDRGCKINGIRNKKGVITDTTETKLL